MNRHGGLPLTAIVIGIIAAVVLVVVAMGFVGIIPLKSIQEFLPIFSQQDRSDNEVTITPGEIAVNGDPPWYVRSAAHSYNVLVYRTIYYEYDTKNGWLWSVEGEGGTWYPAYYTDNEVYKDLHETHSTTVSQLSGRQCEDGFLFILAPLERGDVDVTAFVGEEIEVFRTTNRLTLTRLCRQFGEEDA